MHRSAQLFDRLPSQRRAMSVSGLDNPYAFVLRTRQPADLHIRASIVFSDISGQSISSLFLNPFCQVDPRHCHRDTVAQNGHA